jgi:hypothetical protein
VCDAGNEARAPAVQTRGRLVPGADSLCQASQARAVAQARVARVQREVKAAPLLALRDATVLYGVQRRVLAHQQWGITLLPWTTAMRSHPALATPVILLPLSPPRSPFVPCPHAPFRHEPRTPQPLGRRCSHPLATSFFPSCLLQLLEISESRGSRTPAKDEGERGRYGVRGRRWTP